MRENERKRKTSSKLWPGASIIIWFVDIFYYLFYYPIILLFCGDGFEFFLEGWLLTCAFVLLVFLFIVFLGGAIVPFLNLWHDLWSVLIVGFSDRGVSFWGRLFFGGALCFSGGVFLWFLPNFIKFLYISAIYTPVWSGKVPIPWRFADDIMNTYTNTPFRKKLLIERFGHDIASIILEFLPEWHVYDAFQENPHKVVWNKRRIIAKEKKKVE